MRNLVRTLCIVLGCFSVAGVYAAGPDDESEVVFTEEGEDGSSQQRVFQQEGTDDDQPKN